MKHFVYRLANGGKRMAGVIRGDNERLIAYKAKHPDGDTLYCEVPVCPEHLVTPADITACRAFSPGAVLNIGFVSRLLTTRADWSRKEIL